MSKILLSDEYATGDYVDIREVEIGDCEFILSLRCDDKKSRFINKTEYNKQKQEQYIKHYKAINSEYYFIVIDKCGNPLGTLRMYDFKKHIFTTGSWLMRDDSSIKQILEGSYLMLNFAHKALGYEEFCCDVRKDNKKVIRYHEAMGAKIVGGNDIDFFFKANLNVFISNILKILRG